MSWLFFSYAREDNRTGHLGKLHKALADGIADYVGIDLPKASFRDVDLKPGANWQARTAHALATCKVFVPIYSPRYFQSEWCGREWHCFQQRLMEAGAPTELILPVWWIPPRRTLPACAAAIQDPRYSHGSTMEQRGLLYFRNVKALRARFAEVVATLVQNALEADKKYELAACDLHTFDDLPTRPNAFLAGSNSVGTRSPGPLPAISGPKSVRIVLIAGNRDQMSKHRASLKYYGPTWQDWGPYRPERGDPIGIHTQALVGSQQLESDLRIADGGLQRFIEVAHERHEVVLLVVDSWAPRIDEYGALLDRYELDRFQNVAIVVPTNGADRETQGQIDQLQDELCARLGRPLRTDIDLFGATTSSVPAFEASIKRTIVELRRRIVDGNEPPRQARDSNSHPPVRPRISGQVR